LRLGSLESTAASRLPVILSAFHTRYPEVTIELKTGTNDSLAMAVIERQLDAAFIAQAPVQKELSSLSLFAEHLVLITALAHRQVAKAADVAGESVIAFPQGCAYRRITERWLGSQMLASTRMLELSSYHAIVACVASGTGIAILPESVLATVQSAQVRRHELPKVFADLVTPLVWRTGEQVPAVIALRDLVAAETKPRPRSARRAPAVV